MATVAKRSSSLWWFFLLSLGVLVGSAAVVVVLVEGHAQMYNLTREIPWGLLISTYVFFAVCCSGLCLVSSLGHVFGFGSFEPIGKRAILLAIICLVSAFAAIGMELNHPIRLAIHAVLHPNFSSPIWWMGTLYGGYLAVLVAEFWFLMKGNHRAAFFSGLVGFFLAIGAPSNLGFVFSALSAKPYWHGAFMPMYIIITALVSGSAILSFVVCFRENGLQNDEVEPGSTQFLLARLLALSLGMLIFAQMWNMISALYGQPVGKYEAVLSMLSGPLALNFWLGEVIIGLLVPMGILVNKALATTRGIALASVCAMVGMFFMRYDMVIAGQIVPVRGDGYLHYVPSVTEAAIVIGVTTLALLLYSVAAKKLPLDE